MPPSPQSSPQGERKQLESPSSLETVSQVRSWFDKLTTNGPWYFIAVHPERVEGRTANYDTAS
jgi:hypothetical protein